MVYIRAVLIVTSIVLIWATTVQANSSADQLPEAFYTLFAEWVETYGLSTKFDRGHGQVEFTERARDIFLVAAATLPAFARFKGITLDNVKRVFMDFKNRRKRLENESLVRKQRLASDPNLAQDVFSAEEVADFCMSWLNTKADPRTDYVGNYINLIKEQRQKASHGFYFGITSAINIMKEGFAWCTSRGYTVPVITRPDDTLITPGQLQKDFGFILVKVGAFKLKDTAADVEGYLQAYLTANTGDVDEELHGDGDLHRRMGVQLHKGPAGDRKEKDVDMWSVFVAIGRITKSNFHLKWDDPKRLLLNFNGLPVKMVKGQKRHTPKKSKYLIDGVFNPPTGTRGPAAKAAKTIEDEEDAGVTRGGKKRRTSLAAA